MMVENLAKNEIEIDKKEVLRYLGYGKNNADDKTLEKIEILTEELKKEIAPKVCYEKYPVIKDEDNLFIGMVKTNSQQLIKNLVECEEAYVFVATIGIGADRVIGKYSSISPLDAVICQAIGTAFIEALCDKFCAKLQGFLRPRFSPGYGDFLVENQKQIFEMLDIPRKIGVTLTESMQMVPTKSVSAIIGISKEDTECTKKGCELCEKVNCQYRR